MASSSRQNFGVWAEARNTLRDREHMQKALLRKRREEENANRRAPKDIYHVRMLSGCLHCLKEQKKCACSDFYFALCVVPCFFVVCRKFD